MERLVIHSKDDDGREILLEVIATYHDDELNKDFIIYTDKIYDEKGKLKVYYALYEKQDDNIKLIKTETNEERKVGLMLIKEIMKDIANPKN